MTKIADPLGIGILEAAAGMVRIIDSKMADLIRREVVKSGRHPEDFVLYAFGGASPVHAVGYARDLGVKEILVFPTSSTFSAFGVATADIVHTRLATRGTPLPAPAAELNADLEELERELLAELAGDNAGTDAVFRRQTTGEEIPLPWDRFTDENVAELGHLFIKHYESLYGRGVAYEDAGLELARLRVDLVGPVPKPELRADAREVAGGPDAARKGERQAWFVDGLVATPVYDYPSLGTGAQISGPAIVESTLTTVVLPPGSQLTVDAYRNLVIRP